MKDLIVGVILACIVVGGAILGEHIRTTSSEPEQCYMFTLYLSTYGILKTNDLKFINGTWTFTSSDGVETLVPMANIGKIENNMCEGGGK